MSLVSRINDFVIAVATDIKAINTAIVGLVKTDVAQIWNAQQTFKNVKDVAFTIVDAPAFEIDPANGAVQKVTLGANRTPKATNFSSGQLVTLKISDGTAYTITWTDASLNPTWIGGLIPSLAATGYTHILLWKDSDGLYARYIGTSA